jgi:hypothetical protein
MMSMLKTKIRMDTYPEGDEEEDPQKDQENIPPDPVALPQENVAQVDPDGQKQGFLEMIGRQDTVWANKNNTSMAWKVVGSHEPDPDIILSNTSSPFGLKGFNSKDYMRSEVLAQIFLKMMLMD